MAEKRINPNKFYWNPETKEKIHTEYMDGTKIKLNEGQLKKAEECSAACTRQSNNIAKNNPYLRRKPTAKRNPIKAEEEAAKAELKKAEEIKKSEAIKKAEEIKKSEAIKK